MAFDGGRHFHDGAVVVLLNNHFRAQNGLAQQNPKLHIEIDRNPPLDGAPKRDDKGLLISLDGNMRSRAVFLEVEEDNVAARRLYARRHFREVGRRNAYYRRPEGAARALVLRRDLA